MRTLTAGHIARAALTLLACTALSGRAEAHATSDHFLNLQVEGTSISGHWDVMLNDLDYVLQLDADRDGRVSNEELTRSGQQARDYMLGHLNVTADGDAKAGSGQPCSVTDSGMEVGRQANGRFLRLSLTGECPVAPASLQIDNTLFTDTGDQDAHRGYLNLEYAGQTQTSVFSAGSTAANVSLEAPSKLESFGKFIWLGMTHIWAGLDHVLFLITLLLPSVLRFREGKWQPVGTFREALISVVGVVTAFTVAHSVTLSLAALDVLHLPSRLVEAVIALSVVLAALNNVYPLVRERYLWAVAFAFGLVHGFGFSSVLAELVSDRRALVESLLGFNVGVEIGQLALVAAVVPLIFWLRHTVFYRRLVFAPLSALIAVIGAVWFMERAFA
ncbi:MAG: HupE/UreJ family protein [Deinococcus sp.]|nr:HupE/UreJ family protein [Deinococcus sp.]